MSEKRAIKYFNDVNQRVIADVNFYEDDLLIGETFNIPVPYMLGKDGFLVYMTAGEYSRPHIIEVDEARKDVDYLVISGEIAGGGLEVEFIMKPPYMDKKTDRVFAESERAASKAAAIDMMSRHLDGYIESEPRKTERKKRKTYKVIEVGVKPFGAYPFETAGAIAVRGQEARFAGTVEHQSRLPSFFEERFRAVSASAGTFSGYLEYLVESGGQSDMTFSEVEEVSATSAAQAARIRVARAMKGTKHSKL